MAEARETVRNFSASAVLRPLDQRGTDHQAPLIPNNVWRPPVDPSPPQKIIASYSTMALDRQTYPTGFAVQYPAPHSAILRETYLPRDDDGTRPAHRESREREAILYFDRHNEQGFMNA